MVDLVYGRGITDIIREIPLYVSIFRKLVGIKLFHSKPALYGSADIINVCNLHCSHCYWWLNRKEDNQDLSVQDWRTTIRITFKKQKLFVVTLVGGEPTMRPEIIDVFCKKCPGGYVLLQMAIFP